MMSVRIDVGKKGVNNAKSSLFIDQKQTNQDQTQVLRVSVFEVPLDFSWTRWPFGMGPSRPLYVRKIIDSSWKCGVNVYYFVFITVLCMAFHR